LPQARRNWAWCRHPEVEANPATGSLLILYDLALLASVEALGPLGEIFAELFRRCIEELAADYRN